MRKITLAITPELCGLLGITDNADETACGAAIVATAKKAQKVDQLEASLTAAKQEKQTAETALESFKATNAKKENAEILNKALEDKKITRELKETLEKDYANNPDGLKAMMAQMGVYISVVSQIKKGEEKLPTKFEGKTWDELHKANLLPALKKDHYDLYKQMWEAEHGSAYKA